MYVAGLQKLLAQTYALTIKTQSYHWNVEGENFHSFHKLFEEQYNELADAIDVIAERIRMKDVKVKATFADFAADNTMPPADFSLSALEMVEDLYKDHVTVAEAALEIAKHATDKDDPVTADIMQGRAYAHQKAAWFLKATLQGKK